ncbi:MAG: helix-turn-helix domain-containing protein [Oscillospiraceae bacterium]
MELYEQISKIRKQKEISQEELAEKVGVSRQAVSKWENGTAQPEMANVAKLCEILGVTPNELLGYDGKPAPEAKKQNGKRAAFAAVAAVLLFLLGGVFGWLIKPEVKESGESFKDYSDFELAGVNFLPVETSGNYVTVEVEFTPSVADESVKYSIIAAPYGMDRKVYSAELKDGGKYFGRIKLYEGEQVDLFIRLEAGGRAYYKKVASKLEASGGGLGWENAE